MAQVRRYQDLIAWQKAIGLVLSVYKATAQFPAEERYGLTSQMRRASVSIPSNIAEGWGRQSRMDFVRFLEMARASSYELQTQIYIASELRYIPPEHELHCRVAETERVLNGLIRSLRAKKT
jgi:four helix bundle protein